MSQKGYPIQGVLANRALCSETPYRANPDELVVNKDDVRVCRTVPELMLDGMCPGELRSEVIEVDSVARYDEEDIGVPERIEALIPPLIDAWEKDGRPSCIIRVKSTNSEWNQECEKKLCKAFEGKGVVVNAVGNNPEELIDALGVEREAVKDRRPYKHVIIAIHRATEGINSRTVTHGYCLGVPSAVHILEQFIGRFMRSRLTEGVPIYEGFDERWLNCSKITFIVAKMQKVDDRHAALMIATILSLNKYQAITTIRNLLRLIGLKDGFPVSKVEGAARWVPSAESLAEAVTLINEAEVFYNGGRQYLLDRGDTGPSGKGWAELVLAYVEGRMNGFEVQESPTPLAKDLERALRLVLRGRHPADAQSLNDAVQRCLDDDDEEVSEELILSLIQEYGPDFKRQTLMPGTFSTHSFLARTMLEVERVIREKHADVEKSDIDGVRQYVANWRSRSNGAFPPRSDPGLRKFRMGVGRVRALIVKDYFEAEARETWDQNAVHLLKVWAFWKNDNQAPTEKTQKVREARRATGSDDKALGLVFPTEPLAVYFPKVVFDHAQLRGKTLEEILSHG